MTNSFVSLEQASAHMHQGVGEESLPQAGGAWGVVAQKLETAAEKTLSAITSCDEQYWQSPAAQQAREALTSIAQGLKNNAVVAGQIETATTWVAAAFNKAQAATPTPQHVANNRQTRAQLVAEDRLGLHQPMIAAFDALYESMWLHSLTERAIYYRDTSQALQRVKPWWSPHQQQPTDTPTTAGDHPPTHNAPDIPTQITQHRGTAEWCRLYALDHAIHTEQHQDAYEQQSIYAGMCKGLANHGNATVKLWNKMAQYHLEAEQLHRDLPLGRADISALAHKYVDLATTWHQTKQQTQKTIDAYHAASETQPHLQEIGNDLSEIKKGFADGIEDLFNIHDLDLVKPNLDSYTNSLQRLSEQITNDIEAQSAAGLNEKHADLYAHVAKDIRGCALKHAEEADNAWRDARQHAQSITDHVHDFTLLLQTAAHQDHQAATLAGSSA